MGAAQRLAAAVLAAAAAPPSGWTATQEAARAEEAIALEAAVENACFKYADARRTIVSTALLG